MGQGQEFHKFDRLFWHPMSVADPEFPRREAAPTPKVGAKTYYLAK